MESLEHGMKRGAPIIDEYLGGAVTCDAYHMTDPRSDGLGVSMCSKKFGKCRCFTMFYSLLQSLTLRNDNKSTLIETLLDFITCFPWSNVFIEIHVRVVVPLYYSRFHLWGKSIIGRRNSKF